MVVPFMSLSVSVLFLLTHPATSEIYTLSLHDALPIFISGGGARAIHARPARRLGQRSADAGRRRLAADPPHSCPRRSEEHTSELQSRFDLVCRLLLEKKKKQI